MVPTGAVCLTFLLAPGFLDVQDPTVGDQPDQRLDQGDVDPALERPTSN